MLPALLEIKRRNFLNKEALFQSATRISSYIFYKLTILSASIIKSTESAGVMNLAFLPFKSASETPRA